MFGCLWALLSLRGEMIKVADVSSPRTRVQTYQADGPMQGRRPLMKKHLQFMSIPDVRFLPSSNMLCVRGPIVPPREHDELDKPLLVWDTVVW